MEMTNNQLELDAEAYAKNKIDFINRISPVPKDLSEAEIKRRETRLILDKEIFKIAYISGERNIIYKIFGLCDDKPNTSKNDIIDFLRKFIHND